MLSIDLHVHTTASRDGRIPPDRLPELAEALGLDRLAVCDHDSMEAASWLRARAPGLIIAGEEVRTSAGEVMGLYLQEAVPPGLSLQDTVQCIREQGALVCCPHPFDWLREASMGPAALRSILPSLDLIEVFNSRTILPHLNWRAARWARRHGMTEVVGSDAHRPEEIGLARVELPAFDGPQELLAALREARFTCRRVSLLPRLVRQLRRQGKDPDPTDQR